MAKRSKSSSAWLSRQQRDPYVKKAAEAGEISRARYKLEQLDARFRLLRSGIRVLELGAAPGGWTRYIEERVGSGQLIVCDTRPINASDSTLVIEGAYGECATDEALAAAIGNWDGNPGLDLVLSDMAPNLSGIRTADQARSMELMELALAAAEQWLKPGGGLVVKVFQGAGVENWLVELKQRFRRVKQIKPPASRTESREMYAVAQGFKATE